MKKAAVIVLPILLILVLLVVVLKWRDSARVGEKHVAQSAPVPAQVNSASSLPQPSIFQVITPPNPNATPQEGKSAAERVNRMVTSFHTRMGENPVGTNAEITKSLLGGNPVHAIFSTDTPSLNAKGELTDPWGTPYFFHQISGDEMEIHSAGPDKIMGTADDIIEK